MESLIVLMIAIACLIFVMSFIGIPLSAVVKASKLPNWAKFNASNPWGNPWIDSKRWLKIILIRLLQSIIIAVLVLLNVFILGIKSVIKKIEGTAKKI